MPELSYLRSTEGYKIATQNLQPQEIAAFEQEYMTLCPLSRGGIAGRYVIGTDNNLRKFYLTIDSIKKVFLLNETRKATLFGLTYAKYNHFFLVMIYQSGNNLYERRIVLDKNLEEKSAMNFIGVLLMKNPDIKIGQ